MQQKRFFYHLSDVDHGPVMTTVKRPPKCRAPSEPDVPRLCVAAHIPDCLAAKLMHPTRKVWIYRTPRPIKGVKPFRLWDELLTEERWIWHPARLEKLGFLDRSLVTAAQEPLIRYHRGGWSSGYKVRIAALKLAWDTLKGFYPDRYRQRFVDSLAEQFLKCPAEQFLLDESERRYDRHPKGSLPESSMSPCQ